MRIIALAASLAALAALSGCTPSIGDKCSLSTDCSLQGDRLCDTSQPNGYCTVFNCTADTCVDTAACVLFHPEIQGCRYGDRAPSPGGRTFCLAQCQSDSDCRTADGYICADPRLAPWNALILDDDQLQRVCIVRPDDGVVGGVADASTVEAAVCLPSDPPVPSIDAQAPSQSDANPSSDASADATGTDGSVNADASADAGDAGADARDSSAADAADAGG